MVARHDIGPLMGHLYDRVAFGSPSGIAGLPCVGSSTARLEMLS